MAKLKKNNSVIKINEGFIDLLSIKLIESEEKFIKLDFKDKGILILVTTNLVDSIDNFSGFRIIREVEKRFVELVGLDIKLELNIITKLNIPKRILLIEEIENTSLYRLTFTPSVIEDISKLNEMLIVPVV